MAVESEEWPRPRAWPSSWTATRNRSLPETTTQPLVTSLVTLGNKKGANGRNDGERVGHAAPTNVKPRHQSGIPLMLRRSIMT